MLRALLAKDLRRVWHNPLPWLILVAMPLLVTGVIALTFGGNSSDSALGRIRFAVVDEDDSALSRFLRGGMNQGEGGKYLDPVFLARAEAMRQVNKNEISAVLIIPAHFTRDYLEGARTVTLELIKNPAESVHPAVLDEMLGVVVTALNALSRNFQSEFPQWRAAVDGEGDYHQIAALIERAGRKFDAVKTYVHPPLVVYEKEAGATGAKSAAAPAGKSSDSNGSAIFSVILAGMSAMFLLFLAGNAMNDLYRELRFRTFERYQTLRQSLLPFVAGKVLFALVLLLLCAAVMLGGGGLAFGLAWRRPLPLLCLVVAYCCFAAGLMALLVALMPDERRATVLNNIAGMALGMFGGCMVPRGGLPHFLGAHITPLMPPYWFADTVAQLQFSAGHVSWLSVFLKLVFLGALLIAVSVAMFHRRFQSGARP